MVPYPCQDLQAKCLLTDPQIRENWKEAFTFDLLFFEGLD